MNLVHKAMGYKIDAELFLYAAKRKFTRKVIAWLQPGAERFYCKNGKLLVIGPPGKEYRCNHCFSVAERDTCDRYACMNCNVWLERSCPDEDCHYCKDVTLTPR